MDDTATREREIRGILDAMKKYNLSEGIIVTLSSEEDVSVENMNIHILPAWK